MPEIDSCSFGTRQALLAWSILLGVRRSTDLEASAPGWIKEASQLPWTTGLCVFPGLRSARSKPTPSFSLATVSSQQAFHWPMTTWGMNQFRRGLDSVRKSQEVLTRLQLI